MKRTGTERRAELGANFRNEPLAGFPLFGTPDIDVARDVVSKTFCPHRLEVPSRAIPVFNARHNHVAGNMLSLNHLGYGAEAEIIPGRLEHFYLIQIPLAGTAQISHGKCDFAVGAGVASILNPTLATSMVWHDGCRKLLVQINRSALMAQITAALCQDLPGPVVFEPRIDLARPHMRDWVALLARCVRAAECGRAFGQSGYRFQRVIEEELVWAFVMAQPSSISHFFESPCAQRASMGHVKRARDFIHEHIAEPFAMADLARAAGTSQRSLQLGFQTSFGVSPHHYAMRARLDLAHMRLQLASQCDSVSDIAHDTGFAHLGRFSQTYRQVYGQSPSVTLQTGKSAHVDCSGLRER